MAASYTTAKCAARWCWVYACRLNTQGLAHQTLYQSLSALCTGWTDTATKTFEALFAAMTAEIPTAASSEKIQTAAFSAVMQLHAFRVAEIRESTDARSTTRDREDCADALLLEALTAINHIAPKVGL